MTISAEHWSWAILYYMFCIFYYCFYSFEAGIWELQMQFPALNDEN